jgi:hypothetical protein
VTRIDVKPPAHETTRAYAALRARRQIAGAAPDWALSLEGLDALRRDASRGAAGQGAAQEERADICERENLAAANQPGGGADSLAEELAALDRALERSNKALAGGRAAANLWDPPFERQAWLGNLLIAAMLRARQKTRLHLFCLNCGLRLIRREKRRSPVRTTRLAAFLSAVAAGAEAGMADHDRWLLARRHLQSKLENRRANSRLPALVEMVLARPLVSAGMIAQELGVTPRAAQDMVAALGLREMTGRGRYRAWGLL